MSWVQVVVILLRWLIEITEAACLSRDVRVSPATGTTREVLDVLSDRGADLPETLEQLRDQGVPVVRLNRALVRTARVAVWDPDAGHRLWFVRLVRGVRRQHPSCHRFSPGSRYGGWSVKSGSNQFRHSVQGPHLASPVPGGGQWDAAPGRRDHQTAGACVPTFFKGTRPCLDDSTTTSLLSALRAPTERANALLKRLPRTYATSVSIPRPPPTSPPPLRSSSPLTVNSDEKGSMEGDCAFVWSSPSFRPYPPAGAGLRMAVRQARAVWPS